MNILCGLCRSQSTEKIFDSYNQHGRHVLNTQDKFSLYYCKACGCTFLGGLNIDASYHRKYYQQDYYGNRTEFKILNFFIDKLREWSLKKKHNLITKYFPKNKKLKILDIGCGTGAFLESLDDNKFEKYGIEVNKEGWQVCKEKKLKVFNKDILRLNIQDKFDVITLWHVLEHLEKPMENFKKIRKIMTDDGILICATPNTDSLGFKIGRYNWFHLDSPRHLVLYNKKSINYLNKKSGFKIIDFRYEYYDYPLDLFWSIHNFWMKLPLYAFYPFLKLVSREHLTYVCKKA